jgi:hypothetical protein
MAGKSMGRKTLVILALFAASALTGLFLFTLVFLPGRLVDPIDFRPLPVTEKSLHAASKKVDIFRGGGDTIALTPLDVASLAKAVLEEDLGLEVAGISIRFADGVVVGVIGVRIRDIPTTGYLTWLMRRRRVETTTTLMAVRPYAAGGVLRFEIVEFRIGRFRIPDFAVRRLRPGSPVALESVTVTGVAVGENHLRISRKEPPQDR